MEARSIYLQEADAPLVTSALSAESRASLASLGSASEWVLMFLRLCYTEYQMLIEKERSLSHLWATSQSTFGLAGMTVCGEYRVDIVAVC